MLIAPQTAGCRIIKRFTMIDYSKGRYIVKTLDGGYIGQIDEASSFGMA